MKKYKAGVGGFVTVHRSRTVTVKANSEEEAREKAIDKFVSLIISSPGWHDCDEGTVDWIEEIAEG